MSMRPRTDSWWEPTWGRLAGTTVVLFLVIMAFLVGRVRAGADPGLARETAAPATQQQQVAPPSAGSGADPTDPFAQPQTDPGIDPGAGAADGFGDAVPDQGGAQDSGGQATGDEGGQGFDPPSTHVS
jgi:hypothetical protein